MVLLLGEKVKVTKYKTIEGDRVAGMSLHLYRIERPSSS